MSADAINWFEIPVRDLNRAQRFYETVLDRKLKFYWNSFFETHSILQRMRTLAADVWPTCASTWLLVRHAVSRVTGGIAAEPVTSLSFTT